MGRYQSRKPVAAEFTFDNRVDYMIFTSLCYSLHIKKLRAMEHTDEDGKKWIRSFVEAPEYILWYLEHLMDERDVYYVTTFGMLTD